MESNIKEFIALIEKYESITLSDIVASDGVTSGEIANKLTGVVSGLNSQIIFVTWVTQQKHILI